MAMKEDCMWVYWFFITCVKPSTVSVNLTWAILNFHYILSFWLYQTPFVRSHEAARVLASVNRPLKCCIFKARIKVLNSGMIKVTVITIHGGCNDQNWQHEHMACCYSLNFSLILYIVIVKTLLLSFLCLQQKYPFENLQSPKKWF